MDKWHLIIYKFKSVFGLLVPFSQSLKRFKKMDDFLETNGKWPSFNYHLVYLGPFVILLYSFVHSFIISFISPMFMFIDLCDKGKYSVDGFDIADNGGCTSCSVGFYQDQYGETECKKCPNGLTTVSTGAISLSDCGGELITSQD